MIHTRQCAQKNLFKRTILLLLLIIVSSVGGPVGPASQYDKCPIFCKCYMWLYLRWAGCSGQRIYSIHTGISNVVQALDLSNNSISILEDHELERTGLTSLRYLNLSANAISEIGLSAFAALQELTILDLSKNHLNYILPRTFTETPNLRVLKLSGNNFNQHVPLLESASVTELNIASCRLSHLPLGAFSGLKQLRNLDMSDNLMIQLEEETLRALPFLRILSIKDNPWTCGSRQMQNLQNFLKSRGIRYDSVCPQKNVVKKFEKMLMAPVKSNRHLKPIIVSESPNSGSSGWPIKANKEEETAASGRKEDKNLTNFLAFEATLLCLFGFIMGMALGMVTMYCWLSRSSQRPSLLTSSSLQRYDTISQASQISLDFSSSAAQRVSLLSYIFGGSRENVHRPLQVRPDTPPPPYRDVVLHSERYPIN